jgi:hypothetical protein
MLIPPKSHCLLQKREIPSVPHVKQNHVVVVHHRELGRFHVADQQRRPAFEANAHVAGFGNSPVFRDRKSARKPLVSTMG